MSSNYPPGVTGSEYEIAGPDYEKHVEGECPKCNMPDTLLEQGYKGSHWQVCASCGYQEDFDPIEPDPDRER